MKRILFLTLATFALMQVSAYAAWMEGVVKKVDSKARIVSIERGNKDLQQAYEKDLDVKILENAKLKNITSLDDLKTGQQVKLDARANKEQGNWDANYIELIDSDKKM